MALLQEQQANTSLLTAHGASHRLKQQSAAETIGYRKGWLTCQVVASEDGLLELVVGDVGQRELKSHQPCGIERQYSVKQ